MKLVPWWYVGGAVVTIVIVAIVASIYDSAVVSLGVAWGPAIGLEVKERRARARQIAAGTPLTSRQLESHSEAIIACTVTLALVGLSLGFTAVDPFINAAHRAPVGIGIFGCCLIALGVLLFLAYVRYIRSRQRPRERTE